MAPRNPVQFAIVREDPDVELQVLDRLLPNATRALLIASGGCTALTLAAERPALELTLLDMNAAQLALVEQKVDVLRRTAPESAERARAFGVGADDPSSLSGCGNFESLFRGLRAVLDDLVMSAAERRALLSRAPTPGDARDLVESPYWAVCFEMFFADAMLNAMFTRAATQHAPPGSYPAYFRSVIERGLARADRAANPFLHHVLLGHWLEGALPAFLAAPFDVAPRFTLVHAPVADAPPLAAFDLIQLSNLFDWMDAPAVDALLARLRDECRPGAVVLVRQLNNKAPLERALSGAFRLEEALSNALLARDRSLFYERLLVFVRDP